MIIKLNNKLYITKAVKIMMYEPSTEYWIINVFEDNILF